MKFAIFIVIITWIATIAWGLWNYPVVTTGFLLALIVAILLFAHYGLGRVRNGRF